MQGGGHALGVRGPPPAQGAQRAPRVPLWGFVGHPRPSRGIIEGGVALHGGPYRALHGNATPHAELPQEPPVRLGPRRWIASLRDATQPPRVPLWGIQGALWGWGGVAPPKPRASGHRRGSCLAARLRSRRLSHYPRYRIKRWLSKLTGR